MYKVFLNECQLILRFEINYSSKDNIYQNIDIETVNDFFDLLSVIEKDKHVIKPGINCRMSPDLHQVLCAEMIQISAAGGLVVNDLGQLLFIKRLGKWDLPKGKIENNESIREAALREVEEESGLNRLVVRNELPSTFHLYRSPHVAADNNWVLKKTFWFEMFHQGRGEVRPQTEEAISEVRWFERDKLRKVYTSIYPNLKELLDFYIALSKRESSC